MILDSTLVQFSTVAVQGVIGGILLYGFILMFGFKLRR